MSRLRPNFASGKLLDTTPNTAITATQQTLSSNQFTLLPAVASPNSVELVLDPLALYCTPGTQERVLVTAHTPGSTTVAVTRGYLGTTAISHNNNGVSEDWVAAVSDQDFIHGNLTQLANDDHTQYQNTARHQAPGNHNVAPILSDIFFPGFVIITALAPPNIPVGWLACNGAPVNRTTYANLFAAIGTAYGTGDGATTFNLPQATGTILGGSGTMNGIAYGPSATNSDLLGSHSHTLSLNSNQNPADAHNHSLAAGVGTFGIVAGSGTVASGSGGQHTHDLSGITSGAPNNDTLQHTHITNGSTVGTLTALITTFFTVIIHT